MINIIINMAEVLYDPEESSQMMDTTQYGNGNNLEAILMPNLEEKKLGLLKHRDLPSFYLIWKEEAEFKDELLKFQTNLLRKLCQMEKL
jgi:hypothetical protein